MKDSRDVFICHASEDKATVVRELVQALEEEGISYWYDEAEILWGDSLTGKVNEGLRTSQFVLVVLSANSVEKHWPRAELESILNIEISTREVRVLPLLVGDEAARAQIMAHLPLLNQKKYEVWQGDPAPILDALRRRLGREAGIRIPENLDFEGHAESSIPMPALKWEFSQRDKDEFLRNAFHEIRQYFSEALNRLPVHAPDVETDLDELEKYKFMATVYRHGEVVNRCKVWVGGLSRRGESICYVEGPYLTRDDNSMNDWLSVKSDGAKLGFRPSFLGFGSHLAVGEEDNLSAREAGEYLWMRFIQSIE